MGFLGTFVPHGGRRPRGGRTFIPTRECRRCYALLHEVDAGEYDTGYCVVCQKLTRELTDEQLVRLLIDAGMRRESAERETKRMVEICRSWAASPERRMMWLLTDDEIRATKPDTWPIMEGTPFYFADVRRICLAQLRKVVGMMELKGYSPCKLIGNTWEYPAGWKELRKEVGQSPEP